MLPDDVDFKTSFRPLNFGVTYGSVLGPLLFILFICNIAKDLGPGVYHVVFADDLHVYVLAFRSCSSTLGGLAQLWSWWKIGRNLVDSRSTSERQRSLFLVQLSIFIYLSCCRSSPFRSMVHQFRLYYLCVVWKLDLITNLTAMTIICAS